MGQGKRALPERVKVRFEALTGRSDGRGIFGIADPADAVARQAQL